jgi:hypothetical protein
MVDDDDLSHLLALHLEACIHPLDSLVYGVQLTPDRVDIDGDGRTRRRHATQRHDVLLLLPNLRFATRLIVSMVLGAFLIEETLHVWYSCCCPFRDLGMEREAMR